MTTTERTEEFLGHIDDGRDWAATRMGLDVLAEHGVAGLIQDLLVPVQHESGRRWQATDYTVADEHAVTGLVDELLGAASTTIDRPDEDSPTIVMVCAEAEWHASAARMAALQLRERGVDVRFLGASVPATELETHLRRTAPRALVVSCTMSSALVGAAAMTAVAHRVGVPVVLGGAAFAASPDAGEAIGGDAVAAAADDVPGLLRGWLEVSRPVRGALPGDDPTGERAVFAPTRRRLVQAVIEGTPGPFRPEDELEVEVLLATLDAALLLDDVEVLVGHMQWLGERESVGRLLPLPMEQVVDLLSRSLPSGLTTSRRFLTAAAEHVRAS